MSNTHNSRFEDERDFCADDNYDFRPAPVSFPRPRQTGPVEKQLAHVNRMVKAREPVEVAEDPDPYDDADPRHDGCDEDAWTRQSERAMG